MKWKQFAILFFCSLILLSCNEYQEIPISSGTVEELNQKLETARQNDAGWTQSPEAIARNMFPVISHDGGPKRYQVTKRATSESLCTVTVLEEGPIDDEVFGERHTIELQFNGKWIIVGYQYAAKRRF